VDGVLPQHFLSTGHMERNVRSGGVVQRKSRVNAQVVSGDYHQTRWQNVTSMNVM
jgi:hypothetical protein